MLAHLKINTELKLSDSQKFSCCKETTFVWYTLGIITNKVFSKSSLSCDHVNDQEDYPPDLQHRRPVTNESRSRWNMVTTTGNFQGDYILLGFLATIQLSLSSSS